jgi:hypothetical protein
MANGPVPAYVAPLQPSKTFSEAITQGTQNLGPLLAQKARLDVARDAERRRQQNARLSRIEGFDSTNWSPKHVEAYKELRDQTKALAISGDPRFESYLDSLTEYDNLFSNYAKTTEENRDRMRKGLNEPGSIDTDIARFVSTDQDFISETGIFNKGGFGKFDVIDGRIIGTFLDASGNPLEGVGPGDIMKSPGITQQELYKLDFQEYADVTPGMVATELQKIVNNFKDTGEYTVNEMKQLASSEAVRLIQQNGIKNANNSAIKNYSEGSSPALKGLSPQELMANEAVKLVSFVEPLDDDAQGEADLTQSVKDNSTFEAVYEADENSLIPEGIDLAPSQFDKEGRPILVGEGEPAKAPKATYWPTVELSTNKQKLNLTNYVKEEMRRERKTDQFDPVTGEQIFEPFNVIANPRSIGVIVDSQGNKVVVLRDIQNLEKKGEQPIPDVLLNPDIPAHLNTLRQLDQIIKSTYGANTDLSIDWFLENEKSGASQAPAVTGGMGRF